MVLAGVLELEKLLQSILFGERVAFHALRQFLGGVQIQEVLPELLGQVLHLLPGPITFPGGRGGLLLPQVKVPFRLGQLAAHLTDLLLSLLQFSVTIIIASGSPPASETGWAGDAWESVISEVGFARCTPAVERRKSITGQPGIGVFAGDLPSSGAGTGSNLAAGAGSGDATYSVAAWEVSGRIHFRTTSGAPPPRNHPK